MSHAPRVPRNPFRCSAGWADAPNVQFVGEGTLDEVDVCRVGRPQRKVTVEPCRRCEYGPPLGSHAAIRHKYRISGSWRVVHQSGTITRPVELRHAIKVRSRLPTQRWHRPDTDVARACAILFATPKRDQRTIGR